MMNSWYWKHMEYFPYGHETTKDDINNLLAILLHAITDQLTSMTSTGVYSTNELERMLNVARHMKNSPPSDHTVCSVARMLNVFAHTRFLTYHGERAARLNSDESVHGSNRHTRTLLIKTLGPVLWNAPSVHLRALEKIWVDSTMAHQPWALFIERLKSEWQEFILYSTVILNANGAFLAIPSVDTGPDQRTAAQVASYISIVASVGSILAGLLLVRQYRVKPKDTVEEAAAYLHAKDHPRLGVETLAIVYSLPYALLVWAMVSFLTAFSFQCFITKDRPAIYVTSVGWFIVGFFIVWCIYFCWDENPLSWRHKFTNLLKHQWENAREKNPEWVKRLVDALASVSIKTWIPGGSRERGAAASLAAGTTVTDERGSERELEAQTQQHTHEMTEV
ncbi:hypothetical protein K474DRAFT_1660618 [Panus rudis PR-1116 ss-1]|nr:hypothetical protein K474DRAFT_1660618 [Panus rudis PR-1116 ss-1]